MAAAAASLLVIQESTDDECKKRNFSAPRYSPLTLFFCKISEPSGSKREEFGLARHTLGACSLCKRIKHSNQYNATPDIIIRARPAAADYFSRVKYHSTTAAAACNLFFHVLLEMKNFPR